METNKNINKKWSDPLIHCLPRCKSTGVNWAMRKFPIQLVLIHIVACWFIKQNIYMFRGFKVYIPQNYHRFTYPKWWALEKVASLKYGHFWYMFVFWGVNFGEEKLYFLHVFHRFGCQSYMSDCIMTAYEPSSEENTHQKRWLLTINSNNFRNHGSLKLVVVLM